MKDLQHLLRMVAVFVGSILVYFFVRSYIVPESYGKLGRYRASSVEEIKNLPIKFAGKAGEKKCAGCHPTQGKEKPSGRHQTLACETCHGPLADHMAQPKSIKPVKPKEAEIVAFCVRCHAPGLAKPDTFPTVDPKTHHPDNPCIMCHQPHSPGM